MCLFVRVFGISHSLSNHKNIAYNRDWQAASTPTDLTTPKTTTLFFELTHVCGRLVCGLISINVSSARSRHAHMYRKPGIKST